MTHRIGRIGPFFLVILTSTALVPAANADIRILTATYGANCGAPLGNATTTLAAACNGKNACEYTVNYQVLGDPTPGCAKFFTVEWQCDANAPVRTLTLPGEAGFGTNARLSCGNPAKAIPPPHAHPPFQALPPGAHAPPAPVALPPSPRPEAEQQQQAQPEPTGAEPPAPPNPDNYAIVKVFFGTDRNRTTSVDPARTYGSKRDAAHYGTCLVSIPREHRMGELEGPSIWKLEFHPDPAKHVVLLDVTTLDKDTAFAALAARIKTSKTKSAFVFVHGYNVSFADAARRTAQMSYDLGFDGAATFYSWPSRAQTAAYTIDEATIDWTQDHLQAFLDDFVERSKADNLYLIAHSMGNRALTKAFMALVKQKPKLRGRIKELILTAPDIDADVFRQDIVPVLIASGTPVTLYASSADKALAMSRKVHGAPRAGDSGQRLVVLAGLDTIDATLVDTSFIGHAYFADNKSVLGDIFELFKDHQTAEHRFGLQAVDSPQGRYWAFKP